MMITMFVAAVEYGLAFHDDEIPRDVWNTYYTFGHAWRCAYLR